MNPYLVFAPMLVLVILIFIVWIQMFRVRVREIKRKRIHPQKLTDSRATAAQFEDIATADNFRNLFELPVLFYALCLAIFTTGQLSPALLLLCWLFVITRCLHSWIHCSYNNVMHRFRAYVVGGFALFGAWLLFAILLLRQGWLIAA